MHNFYKKIKGLFKKDSNANQYVTLLKKVDSLEKRVKQLESSNIAILKRLIQKDTTSIFKKGKAKLFVVKSNKKDDDLKHCKILPFNNIDDDPTFH